MFILVKPQNPSSHPNWKERMTSRKKYIFLGNISKRIFSQTRNNIFRFYYKVLVSINSTELEFLAINIDWRPDGSIIVGKRCIDRGEYKKEKQYHLRPSRK